MHRTSASSYPNRETHKRATDAIETIDIQIHRRLSVTSMWIQAALPARPALQHPTPGQTVRICAAERVERAREEWQEQQG